MCWAEHMVCSFDIRMGIALVVFEVAFTLSSTRIQGAICACCLSSFGDRSI